MNLKRLIIFALTTLASLIVALIESQIIYSWEHFKTVRSIQYAEIMTFISYGWLWFLPLLGFAINVLYDKWWSRWMIWISPLLIMIGHYTYVLANCMEETDYMLYAGYFYRYPYYMDIIVSSLLTIIGVSVIVEVRKKRMLSKSR